MAKSRPVLLPASIDEYWQPAADAYWNEKLRKRADRRLHRQGLTSRQNKIADVIERGAKGTTYCRELDGLRVKPCSDWIEQGCPSSYAVAYADSFWRAKILNEKSYISRKLREVAKQIPA